MKWTSEEDRAFLSEQKGDLTVYRGYNKPHAKLGFSWTLSAEVASKMPTRRSRGRSNPWLVIGSVNPNSVIALLGSRKEKEIVVSPRDVKVLREIQVDDEAQ